MRRAGARDKDQKNKSKAATEDDQPSIWATILKDAAATKPTPTVTLLVLGDPQTGKSTVLSAVAHDDPGTQTLEPHEAVSGLALQFAYADVFDASDAEEPAALVGMYEMDGDAFAHLVQVSVGDAQRLATSAVVICLDWSKPHSFLESLEKYFLLLEKELGPILGSAGEKGNELKTRIETAFREYREPDEAGNKYNTAALDGAITAHNVTLPLGQGVLTTNLGVPVIVACCKADNMIALEKEKGYGDGTFDYIQQSLRTICLKYGAALFYTSTYRPKSLALLKSYVLHQLTRTTDNASSFPFPHRAEVIDREAVCVPSGWDNWGLIRVQGSGFACEAFSGVGREDYGAEGWATASLKEARALYESEIGEPAGKNKVQATKPMVAADDEQVFLERNLEVLNSMSAGTTTGTASPYAGASESFAQRLASSNLSSSDMMEDVSAKLAKLAKLKEQTASAALRNKSIGPSDMPLPTSPAPSFPLPTSAGVASLPPSSPSPAGGAANNEVLSNFFQSLLNKKSSAAVLPMSARSPSIGTNLSASGRAPSVGSGRVPSVAGSVGARSVGSGNVASPVSAGAAMVLQGSQDIERSREEPETEAVEPAEEVAASEASVTETAGPVAE